MSIPIDTIVNIQNKVIQASPPGIEFAGLMLSSETPLTPLGAIYKRFYNAAEVGVQFGNTSNTYKYAINYFLGATISPRTPYSLIISTCDADATEAEITELMDDVYTAYSNWVTVACAFNESASYKVALRQWSNANPKRFLYFQVDQTAATPDMTVEGTAYIKGTPDKAFFIMGAIDAIDFNSVNGRTTMAFRQQSGLTPDVSDNSEAQTLLGLGYNYYGAYANATISDNIFYNGQCAGTLVWIDTYIGQIFMRNGLQNAWWNVLKGLNTAPYNEDGYSYLYGAATSPLQLCVNNGIIQRGVTLDSTQEQQVRSQVGANADSALNSIYTTGYYLLITDPGATVRQERGSPNIALWYTDGQSIQKIEGTATTIL